MIGDCTLDYEKNSFHCLLCASWQTALCYEMNSFKRFYGRASAATVKKITTGGKFFPEVDWQYGRRATPTQLGAERRN
jgi:hypothetical protein